MKITTYTCGWCKTVTGKYIQNRGLTGKTIETITLKDDNGTWEEEVCQKYYNAAMTAVR